jgi:hypothetical protein
MEESVARELRNRVAASRAELQVFVNQYGDLLGQLETLEQVLASGEFDQALLKETQRRFEVHPLFTAWREATGVDAGLPETRALVLLLNRLVLFPAKPKQADIVRGS